MSVLVVRPRPIQHPLLLCAVWLCLGHYVSLSARLMVITLFYSSTSLSYKSFSVSNHPQSLLNASTFFMGVFVFIPFGSFIFLYSRRRLALALFPKSSRFSKTSRGAILLYMFSKDNKYSLFPYYTDLSLYCFAESIF
jgi:hypothetical protein